MHSNKTLILIHSRGGIRHCQCVAGLNRNEARADHKQATRPVSMATNQEWVFLARPQPSGMALSDWELRDCAQPQPVKGEELLCATYLCSVDPTMRNAMAGPETVALTAQTDVGYYVRDISCRSQRTPQLYARTLRDSHVCRT